MHTLKNNEGKKENVALTGYDCVLLAIGRIPNTDLLELDGLVSFFAVSDKCCYSVSYPGKQAIGSQGNKILDNNLPQCTFGMKGVLALSVVLFAYLVKREKQELHGFPPKVLVSRKLISFK